MGNTKRNKEVYKDIKEEPRQCEGQLHGSVNCIQEEETTVASKVQKEQLNARFMSFYNSSNTWDKSKRGGLNAVTRIAALRSGKALSFADVVSNRWSQRARSAVSPDFKAVFERAQRAMEDGILLSVSKWGSSVLSDALIQWKSDTTDVRVLLETRQLDHERSVAMWRELIRDSSAFNNVLEQLERVTANVRVASGSEGRDVKFQIAMWGESSADFNIAWERLKRASLVFTSSNSEKGVVEVGLHHGVSTLVEGFLFEANTNLPQNINITLSNDGSHGNLSGRLGWFRLDTHLLQTFNNDKTCNNEGFHNSLWGLYFLQNNITMLNDNKNCDSPRRLFLDGIQTAEVAPDSSVKSAQRGFEQTSPMIRSLTRHTNLHQL